MKDYNVLEAKDLCVNGNTVTHEPRPITQCLFIIAWMLDDDIDYSDETPKEPIGILNIETIQKKLQDKCPEVEVSALFISRLLHAIEEIILEDRKEIGHYTEDEFRQECFKRCIPTKNNQKK